MGMSRIDRWPLLERPPEASMTNAIGAHSYNSRSLGGAAEDDMLQNIPPPCRTSLAVTQNGYFCTVLLDKVVTNSTWPPDPHCKLRLQVHATTAENDFLEPVAFC